ncbi:MAG: hypothetical protein ABW061_09695 [Polyangiaceae bacterium]
MTGKSALFAGLGIVTVALIAIIGLFAPPLSGQDTAFVVACVASALAAGALWLPLVSATQAKDGSAAVWFKAAPFTLSVIWLAVAIIVVFVSMMNTAGLDPQAVPRDKISWKLVVLVHVLLATVWAIVTFGSAGAAATVARDERQLSAANEQFEKAKSVAADLRGAMKGASPVLQVRVQRLVSAVSYAPRARFVNEQLAQALIADLEILASCVSNHADSEIEPALVEAERHVRELGIAPV